MQKTHAGEQLLWFLILVFALNHNHLFLSRSPTLQNTYIHVYMRTYITLLYRNISIIVVRDEQKLVSEFNANIV